MQQDEANENHAGAHPLDTPAIRDRDRDHRLCAFANKCFKPHVLSIGDNLTNRHSNPVDELFLVS